MTEDLNPGWDDMSVALAGAKIDWKQGPAIAAAWIAVGVQQRQEDDTDVVETHACWFTDTRPPQRIPAPSFGIVVPDGGKLIIRRPGHHDIAMGLEILRSCFWKLQGLNEFLSIKPPDPNYERPIIQPDQLAFWVMYTLRHGVQSTLPRSAANTERAA